MSVFLIAEAGSCHDSNLNQAFALVETAKQCGADAVKFQTFNAKTLAERRNAPDYLPIYQQYEMPLEWLPCLYKKCEDVGIELMTTIYHQDYLEIVMPFIKRAKISSFEAADHAFINAHRQYGKPLIISTGMATEKEISKIPLKADDTLLLCTSSYPAPLDQINLNVLRSWGEHGGWHGLHINQAIGLSDHSLSMLTGAVAVGAGATVLEKHFRLIATSPQNPDYKVSLDPYSFAEYVRRVREAEVMMGSGIKEPQACEAEMQKYRVRSKN